MDSIRAAVPAAILFDGFQPQKHAMTYHVCFSGLIITGGPVIILPDFPVVGSFMQYRGTLRLNAAMLSRISSFFFCFGSVRSSAC